MGLPSGSDAAKRHLAARVLQRKAAQAPNGPMPKRPWRNNPRSCLPAVSPTRRLYSSSQQHQHHAAVHHHESSFNITVIVKLHLALVLVTVFRHAIGRAHVLSLLRASSVFSCVTVLGPSASKCRGVLQTAAAAVSQTEIMKTVKTLQLYRVLRYPGLVWG